MDMSNCEVEVVVAANHVAVSLRRGKERLFATMKDTDSEYKKALSLVGRVYFLFNQLLLPHVEKTVIMHVDRLEAIEEMLSMR